MLKSGLEYDAFCVYSHKSLESKTYLMFIACIVCNCMFQQLKQVTMKENDQKNYTVSAMIGELDIVTVVKNSKAVDIEETGCCITKNNPDAV